MCLIFISYRKHPDFPLIIAANRDEYYLRPTAYADFWQAFPNVLAGRDLQHSGTWLGITRNGRFSFITNFRNPALNNESARSRGELTRDFLTGEAHPAQYAEIVHSRRKHYNGFNLFTGNLDDLYYCASELNQIQAITPGNYGISNGLLDDPWPKVVTGKQLFNQCVKSHPDIDCLMALLADRSKARVSELPDTGINKELEHTLSSRFIATPLYGTRSSTVITVNKNKQVHFLEKNFLTGENQEVTKEYKFDLEPGI